MLVCVADPEDEPLLDEVLEGDGVGDCDRVTADDAEALALPV